MRNKSKKQKYFLFMRSPVALAVSWLKFESWSQILPVMEANPGFHYFHYIKYFCFLLLYGLGVLSVTACINKTNMTETLAQTFLVAVVIETGLTDSVTGKFETSGSNFSNEIRKAKLLATLLPLKSLG